MDEFAPFHDVHFLEAVLYEVLDSLHVVVGHLFDVLHLCRIFRCHVPVDVPECLELRGIEIGELRQRNAA